MVYFRKRLPLPKLVSGRYAFVVRYVCDWLLPKGLPAFSAFLLVRALLQAEMDAAKTHHLPKFGLNGMLEVLMDKISGGYITWTLYALAPCVLMAMVAWTLQYYDMKPFRRRQYKAHNTLAHWLVLSNASLLGLYLTPLALATAIAFSGNIPDLKFMLPAITGGAFGLAFLFYRFAYTEMAQAEMLTISVSSNKAALPLSKIEAQLALAEKQMANALDGLWSCLVLVDQKAASGQVVMGFRTMKDEWTAEQRRAYEEVISSQRKFWTAHGYTFRLLGYAPPSGPRQAARSIKP